MPRFNQGSLGKFQSQYDLILARRERHGHDQDAEFQSQYDLILAPYLHPNRPGSGIFQSQYDLILADHNFTPHDCKT